MCPVRRSSQIHIDRRYQMITPLLPFLFSFLLNTQPPMPPTDAHPSTISQKDHAQRHPRQIKWVILTREGTCLPLTSLNQEFPDFPKMTSPQALHQYLSKHHGTPVLSPIKDPSKPDLVGYSLLDTTLHLSFLIFPSDTCKGQFRPVELPIVDRRSESTP